MQEWDRKGLNVKESSVISENQHYFSPCWLAAVYVCGRWPYFGRRCIGLKQHCHYFTLLYYKYSMIMYN